MLKVSILKLLLIFYHIKTYFKYLVGFHKEILFIYLKKIECTYIYYLKTIERPIYLITKFIQKDF